MSYCLLTIVTVTKNCAATIGRTLASVRAIKRPGIEYVVVDGASSDSTLDIVRGYCSLVDYLVSEPDTGIYNAMNKGAKLANGQYVLFINGDDELVSVGFPNVMMAMEKSEAEIICASTLVSGSEGSNEALIANPWRLPFFNSIPHPSAFVSTTLLQRLPFREDLRIVSDYDFFLQAYLQGCRFQVLPVVTALHKRGGTSGDVAASIMELERVRRERLGWRYPVANAIAGLYRFGKRLVRRSANE